MATSKAKLQALPPAKGNPFGNSGSQHHTPSFTEVGNLAHVLDAVCRAGCAIMFGHTRDGGAVVITVLDGDNRYKQYCANADELERSAESIFAAYEEL